MIRRLLARLNPLDFWNRARSNPVILKEMRSRMRGWRALIGTTAFLAVIGGTVGMIYFGYTQSGAANQGIDVRKNIGQTIFYTIYMMQLFIVMLTAPTLTAGAIAAEREQQTYDLLRTTLLSAWDLVSGKLIAAVSFIVLLFVASIPLQGIGLIFGGVSFGEVALGMLVLILTALAFGAVGLFFSSLSKRARVATVLAQITTTTFSVVLPIVALALISMIAAIYSSRLIPPPELLMGAIGWLVAICSPIATAVATEAILVNEQSYFFFQATVNGNLVWVPSPWLGFVILYPIVTAAFLALSVRIIRRPEKQ